LKKLLVVLLCVGALTGCTQTPEEYYQEKARTIKACKDAGGEWYDRPGWGESCNFDSRKEK